MSMTKILRVYSTYMKYMVIRNPQKKLNQVIKLAFLCIFTLGTAFSIEVFPKTANEEGQSFMQLK